MNTSNLSDVPPLVARRFNEPERFWCRMIYDQLNYLYAIGQKRIWISLACTYVAAVAAYIGIVHFNLRTIYIPGHETPAYPAWPLWLFGCLFVGRTSWRITGAYLQAASVRAQRVLNQLARNPNARPVLTAIRDHDPRIAYSYKAHHTLADTELSTIF